MEVVTMSKVKMQYDEDFKKNAVKLSYASPKTVTEAAAELRYPSQ